MGPVHRDKETKGTKPTAKNAAIVITVQNRHGVDSSRPTWAVLKSAFIVNIESIVYSNSTWLRSVNLPT